MSCSVFLGEISSLKLPLKSFHGRKLQAQIWWNQIYKVVARFVLWIRRILIVEAMQSNVIVEIMCKVAIYGKFVNFYCNEKALKFQVTFIQIWCLLALCNNVTDMQEIDSSYGKTWMFFPDGEGFPQIISLTIDEQTKLIAHESPDSKIKMWLYNKWEKKSKSNLILSFECISDISTIQNRLKSQDLTIAILSQSTEASTAMKRQKLSFTDGKMSNC